MSKNRFSEEFKAEAVQLVLDQGVPPGQASKDLGIGLSTLDKWLKQHREKSKPAELTEDERSEIKRLRKELINVKMERDILKIDELPLGSSRNMAFAS